MVLLAACTTTKYEKASGVFSGTKRHPGVFSGIAKDIFSLSQKDIFGFYQLVVKMSNYYYYDSSLNVDFITLKIILYITKVTFLLFYTYNKNSYTYWKSNYNLYPKDRCPIWDRRMPDMASACHFLEKTPGCLFVFGRCARGYSLCLVETHQLIDHRTWPEVKFYLWLFKVIPTIYVSKHIDKANRIMSKSDLYLFKHRSYHRKTILL